MTAPDRASLDREQAKDRESGASDSRRTPRKYVEQVEYPEMTFGPDGYWLTCGYCGWDGPIRATRRAAERDRWRHPDIRCWLKALYIDSWIHWRFHAR